MTFERGLFLGGILFLLGVAGSCYAISLWQQQGYAGLNPVQTLRIVMPSGFAIINGALLALAAVFFQVLRFGKKK